MEEGGREPLGGRLSWFFLRACKKEQGPADSLLFSSLRLRLAFRPALTIEQSGDESYWIGGSLL